MQNSCMIFKEKLVKNLKFKPKVIKMLYIKENLWKNLNFDID